MAAACSGLLDERGNTGALALPAVNANRPSGPIATMLPRCRDSTNPDRITSASTGLAATSLTDICSHGVTRHIMAGPVAGDGRYHPDRCGNSDNPR